MKLFLFSKVFHLFFLLKLQEGKLRILQFDKSNGLDHTVSCFPDEDMLEVVPEFKVILFWLEGY